MASTNRQERGRIEDKFFSDRPLSLPPIGSVSVEPRHRLLGMTDDELKAIEALLGRAPVRPRAGHVLGDVVGTLFLQVVPAYTWADSPPKQPWVLVGPGEGAGVIDVGGGIWPWPCASRATTTRRRLNRTRGRPPAWGGSSAAIPPWGPALSRLMDPLRFGPLHTPPQPLSGRRGGLGDLQLWEFRRCTDGGRRDRVRSPATAPIPWSTFSVSACSPTAPSGAGPGRGGRQPCRAPRRLHRARRHRRGQHPGLGRVRRIGRRPQAPLGPGRRSVRGEEAHRGLPGPPRFRPSPSACRTWAPAGLSCAASETAAKADLGMDVDIARGAPPGTGDDPDGGDDPPRARNGCWPSSPPRTSTRSWPCASGGRSGPRSSAR